MSTLKTNTLTGTTSAGSINVTGEGGSTTTNLQQGLAKAWCVFNGEGTVAITDSNNSASLTDVAQGDYTLGFTNNMNSAAYAVSGSSVGSDSGSYYNFLCGDSANNTTSVYEINFVHRSSGQVDNDHSATIVHGDLA
jgi:hypothetical protein